MRDHDFKALLQAACADLWWSSESDCPVEAVWQPENASIENASTENALIATLLAEASALTPLTLIDIFAQQVAPQSWDTAEDKAQKARLFQLQELLENNLTHPQVYRYGEVEVTVCILGRTAEGTLAGVRTVSVET